jgi:hypothetical protein
MSDDTNTRPDTTTAKPGARVKPTRYEAPSKGTRVTRDGTRVRPA